MNQETKNDLDNICKKILPHDRFSEKPYRCGQNYDCIDVVRFAGNKYCGRMLRMQREDEEEIFGRRRMREALR